ncbi:hypothetical protein [Phytobacter sp. V91]|uniref:hypothetical protein n=1 Tax=Phytobacter sp. V91 TaxID=3369425 RepID=UPI003F5FF723
MPAINLGVSLPPRDYRNISEFVVERIFDDLPFKTGMVGAYFLSNQTVSPLINYANAELPLTRIGNPVVGATYTTLDHSNYYDTGLPSTESLAVIGISLPAVSTTAQSGVVLSNYKKDETTANIAQGDTLRAYASAGNVRISQFSDFAMSTPPQVNLVTSGLSVDDLIISYGLIQPIAGKEAGAAYYNPTTDANVSAFYSGTSTNPRRVETVHTLRIGTTHSDTEFLGISAVSVVLVFNQDLGGTGIIANQRWLKETFGPRFGL